MEASMLHGLSCEHTGRSGGGDSEPKRGTGGVEHSSCQGLKKRSVT